MKPPPSCGRGLDPNFQMTKDLKKPEMWTVRNETDLAEMQTLDIQVHIPTDLNTRNRCLGMLFSGAKLTSQLQTLGVLGMIGVL